MPRACSSPAPALKRATLDSLRAALGDDRAQALVCLFRDEMHRRVHAILCGIDSPPIVAREADVLASAARSVGLVALGAIAEQLVTVARRGHTDALVDAIDALLRAVHEALAVLREAGYSPTPDSPATDPWPQDARLR